MAYKKVTWSETRWNYLKQTVIIHACVTYLLLSFCLSAQLFQSIWISIFFMQCWLVLPKASCCPFPPATEDPFPFRTEGWCRNQRLRGTSIRNCISEEAEGLKYLWRAPRTLLWLGPHESAWGKELFWTNSLVILYICRTKQMLIHRAPDCVRQEY